VKTLPKSTTLNTTKSQKAHRDKDLEKNMWTAGLKYNWRK